MGNDLIALDRKARRELEQLLTDGNTAQKIAKRARIVLMTADGHGVVAIMREVGVSKTTVWRWQDYFAEAGVDGLIKGRSKPPGRKPLSAAMKLKVVEKTVKERPANATHWSVRSMAEEMGISHTSVQRIWAEHGLKPHLVRSFKISNDPDFVAKVEDIVGLYVDPPEKALVLSVDEKRYHGEVDSDRHFGRVRLLPPTLEATMQTVADRPEAPTAIRTDLGAIFVSLELSRSTWLITSLSPGGGEKMSKQVVRGGDVAGLLERFARLREKARARTGKVSRSSSFRRLASTDSGSIARCRMKGSKATSWIRPRLRHPVGAGVRRLTGSTAKCWFARCWRTSGVNLGSVR